MIDRSTQQSASRTTTDGATTPNLRDPMVRAQPFVSLALEFALRDGANVPTTRAAEIETAHVESVLAD